ncbi:MAG: NAD(P)-dependent glycerol-3-phosphate dehydrogenase [Candidatus Eisenbacteria sp.]|nr:NAD(P)-dependent glycerol-3-phosphate dehydrogenase [Candidatus Eisenbacteria bacterium]
MRGDIAVLGAGSWGTTLALHLARQGRQVRLWEVDPPRAREIARTRLSLPFLPDYSLPQSIDVTSELGAALDGAAGALLVVPSHVLRSVGEAIERTRARSSLQEPRVWISATKGIEEGSGQTPAQVICESAGIPASRIVVLAGPSLAAEVAAQLPTALLAASENEEASRAVQRVFSSPSLRVYTSPDPLGVELGVSLKNVIAIAAGISEGLQLGQNAMGALLTRGLVEITRLGVALGARRETFLGLSGIGDLVTTCTSRLSRNHRVGLGLAEGRPLAQILDQMVMVAEGVRTTRSALELARSLGVEMPITRQVYAVLFERKDAHAALADLMGRPLKQEFWGQRS